jgi:hypothetical protein
MSLNVNIEESTDNVNKNIEFDMQMKKIREELLQKFEDYRVTINFMAADAPIAALCLSPATEKILIDNGFLRIYDLFNVDFTKIKGLGIVRIRDLTSRIDQFLSML